MYERFFGGEGVCMARILIVDFWAVSEGRFKRPCRAEYNRTQCYYPCVCGNARLIFFHQRRGNCRDAEREKKNALLSKGLAPSGLPCF